ncbi:fatty-acyl coenzyme A oxidase [Candidozyma auris]|uniref:Acyl-coenzyme A oxidase n=2 Tax=Candidozyma auris TaxID=498019 RepID=A0AB36W228_CANAR|nr:hypothetical protein CJI97_002401 [[Candida] auris]PIS55636.1 hypothetical protein B9J08_001740 [[Candida] auris]PSK78695.1 hypothetical protein CJJ07_001467 [[Candida] auris]QEL59656.1 hypothetical protein CJJ09_001738 [[Candida] auris]QWW22725.1 hypothetical protein CA7LBN_001471 [[Candida] auris]
MADTDNQVSGFVDSTPAPNPRALLLAERAKGQFDPNKMHIFLEETAEKSRSFKRLVQQLDRDPILATGNKYYDLTKDQQRENTAVRIARLAQYIENDSQETWNQRVSLLSVLDPQTGTRIGVNLGLFLGCIRGNGTFEQLDYWAKKKETGQLKGLYGCFGMTELAHGSNVAGLETTATFDKETDEFIINTPHIGATKWWIGGAAHSATHCAVYARLIVDGKDYGVKTFVVPLRDADHNLMPGVTVGDIGAKMGRDGIDNGWIQFSSVRIPRFFMLQKFCQVSREGKVNLPPLEQLAYSALLGGRVSMVMDSFRWTARFATIALRFAIGRRQFKSASQADGTETQLLNYPLHQRRLIPFLAQAYVFSAGAWKLEHTIKSTLDTLDAAVAAGDMGKIMKSVNDMKSLFIDSAALKSTSTWLCADAIDQCRQACGGLGYSSYNGFGKGYADWVVQCTWEGDNSILAMSVGKPLIRAAVEVLKTGKKQKGSVAFLNEAKEWANDKLVFQTADELLEPKNTLKAIQVLMTRVALNGAEVLKENNGNFDAVGAPSLVLSKLNAHFYHLNEFYRRIETNEHKELNSHLILLGKLHAASFVFEKFGGDLLSNNIVPPAVLNEVVNKKLPELCKQIRPNVVAYTDSFMYSDTFINAPIARYDGNIYENYFDTVKKSNPPENTKAPYSAAFETALNRAALEVRERGDKSAAAAALLSK